MGGYFYIRIVLIGRLTLFGVIRGTRSIDYNCVVLSVFVIHFLGKMKISCPFAVVIPISRQIPCRLETTSVRCKTESDTD
jgi:hypothetical protein